MDYLGGHSRNSLNVGFIESSTAYGCVDPEVFGRLCTIESNGILPEKVVNFVNVFQGVQMKQYRLTKFPFRFLDRPTKGRCAELLTTGYPSITFFAELKSDDYITRSCWHWLPSSFGAGAIHGTKVSTIN